MKVHVEPVSAIVMDIEGTTSSARHVYEVLFPYARSAMATWVEQHGAEPVTRGALAEVAEQLGVEPTDTAPIVAQLVQWIDDDVKAAPLKTLQGLMWQEGYARGELTSHMFDDVPPTLRTWHTAGIPLVIYSSGSVAAQKALFANAPDGDLDSLIDANFDITTAGPKREQDSYARIAQALNAQPEQLLFLSDIQDELDAARAAGWQVVGVLREGETQATAGGAPLISSFAELDVSPVS
jgi:enolase-phosphatase E1